MSRKAEGGRIAIVSNGEMADPDFYISQMRGADLIICADGGANKLFEWGVKPDIIVGDCDSISPEVKKHYESQNVRFEVHPSHKDQTDTELAIDIAVSLKPAEVVLLGMFGGRIDHTLANIQLLERFHGSGIDASIADENQRIFIVEGEAILHGEEGEMFSLLAVSEEARGVCIEGARYPLRDATIRRGTSLGVSNVIEGEAVHISVRNGLLLCVQIHKNT
ncbi:MAG: thiamine diphosphokinase [bacterium]